MAQVKFNSSLAGVAYVAVSHLATIADNNGIVYDTRNRKGQYAYLTGYYYTNGDVNYLQTTINNVWLLNVGSTPDWVKSENIKPKSYTQSQAQYLVDQIIKNNIAILQNNLVCARFANKFTAQQRQQIRELQQRVQERNNALMDESLIQADTIKSGYPKGYAELEPYLNKLMQGEGVGAITWATVVFAALIIAALSTAVYYAYKVYYDQSEKDIKYSKELTKILTSKLTEEEYQQLLSETQGIVTKSRLRAAVGSYLNAFRYLAYGIAGYAIYKFIKEKRKK